jgi:transposase
MNNRDQLIDLMRDRELERREVAAMLKVSIETVQRWLLPLESKHREDIPDMAIELLELKLKALPQKE